jgi:hypothetical protein
VAIDGEAFMRVHACGEKGKPSDEPLCGFQVKARSLLLALQAAIDDEQSPEP